MQGARPLTVKEVFIVLRYCKDVREECLIVIGMNLGLRVSELVTLKWRDVMHRGHVLPLLYLQRNLTKGKRPRGVPINTKEAKAILRLHRSQKNGRSLKPDNYLFSGGTKGHLCCRHINRLLYALFDRAGLSGRLSSHTLRKTFGTILSDRGVNLPVIQELLGHADITTTRKYIGVGMGNMQKAVGLLAKAF